MAKLREFWELASEGPGRMAWSSWWTDMWSDDNARRGFNQLAAGLIIANGVPGFSAPRAPPPYLRLAGAPGASSWYDTSALRPTLERLVDFDHINTKETRFRIGAVNVRSDNLAYLDNATDRIGPEHVMASGALPPAFEAVEIDGEFYWGGGMVSNRPLDRVLSSRTDLDTLMYLYDAGSARTTSPSPCRPPQPSPAES